MKTKWLGLILGICFLLPSAAFANGKMPEVNGNRIKETGNCHEGNRHHMMDKNWHEKMKQKEQKLLGLVSVYTPDKQKEWETVINERNRIREKWLSPEFANKRAQWKKEYMSKMDTLKKQYEEGTITKKEYMKKVHGTYAMGDWKTYHELKNAVKNKNNKKAAALLNNLLVQFKKQNQMMKAAMSTL